MQKHITHVDGIGDVAVLVALRHFGVPMPRQARLDAPNSLHHVMVRGIERETGDETGDVFD